MLRTLVLASLLAAACKYSSPDPEVGGPKEPSVSPEAQPVEPAIPPSTEGAKRETPEDAKRAPTEASGSCDDRSCVSTDDCCKGYQCGFDQERSKVQRYCLVQ